MASAESEPLLKLGNGSEVPEPLQRTTSHGGEPLQRTSSQGGEPLQRTWSQGQVKQWAEWAQFVVEAAGDGPVEVDPSEIREAATQDPYPQWIYGALVTPANSGQLDPPLIYGEVITPENSGQLDSLLPIPHAVEGSIPPNVMSSVQGLHEDEIRELIVEYVDHQCCWGKRPASKWSFKKIEDCNAFIGALESFIEERDSYADVEPYTGQQHTTAEQGRQLGRWEVDMRDEFPLLFTVKKEVKSAIPFSQRVEVCKTCSGKKEVPCAECHSIDESGAVGPRKTAPCTVCHGRGLIAHQDGSDTNCEECQGTGMQECKRCGLRGLVKCPTCDGCGSLLHSQILVARWRTLINKKISASSHAATLPDDVLHEAGGIDLHTDQSHTCQPVQFVDSYGLTKLSADVFATREEIPPTSRLIVERHQLRLIPVTHVVMSDGDRSFQFYIVGLGKQIYMKNYPVKCGLCCCMEMCHVQ